MRAYVCFLTLLVVAVASAQSQFTMTYSGSGGQIPDGGGYGSPLVLRIQVPDRYQILRVQSVSLIGISHGYVGDLIARFGRSPWRYEEQVALFQRVFFEAASLFGDYTFIPNAGYPTIEDVRGM